MFMQILQIADRSVLKLPPVPSLAEEDTLQVRLHQSLHNI